MKSRVISRGLCAVALLIVSAFLLVASAEETAQAHGGSHTLYLEDNAHNYLAHWNDGGFYYRIDDPASSRVPSGWRADMGAAASHVKRSTFMDRLDARRSSPQVMIRVGSAGATKHVWPRRTGCGSPPSPSLGSPSLCLRSTANPGRKAWLYA